MGTERKITHSTYDESYEERIAAIKGDEITSEPIPEEAKPLKELLEIISNGFLESVMTDGMKFVDGLGDLNGMSDEDFNALFDEICTREGLDGEEIEAAYQLANKKAAAEMPSYEILSKRQIIMLDLHAMVKSSHYRR